MWLAKVGVKTLFNPPGRPWENGCNEALEARSNDEAPNREIFHSRREAQVMIESWRHCDDKIRPRSALGSRPSAPEAMISSWPDPASVTAGLRPDRSSDRPRSD